MTYLAHETCEATGRVFSVGGGRVAEVFIGETPGYFNARPHAGGRARQLGARSPTATATRVPTNLGDETALFLPFLA